MSYQKRPHWLRIAPLAFICAVSLLAAASNAAPFDDPEISYGTYVGARALHDDNPGRTASNSESSSMAEISAGVAKKVTFGQQNLQFGANIYHQDFEDIDLLSHTGGDANVRLAWKLSAALRGNVAVDYNRALRDQEHLNSIDGGLRESTTVGMGVTHAFNTATELELRLARSLINIERSEDLDVDRDKAILRLTHRLRGDNKQFGLEINALERNADSSNPLDTQNDFSQQAYGIFARWQVGTSLGLRGKLLHASRDTESGNNFDGLIGSAAATLKASEKTSVVLEARRQVSNLSDESSDYAVIDSVTLQPNWQPTERLNLSLFAGYETREFEGISQREDDVTRAGAALTWKLLKASSVSFVYEYGDRSSNVATFDYDYEIFSLQLRLATTD